MKNWTESQLENEGYEFDITEFTWSVYFRPSAVTAVTPDLAEQMKQLAWRGQVIYIHHRHDDMTDVIRYRSGQRILISTGFSSSNKSLTRKLMRNAAIADLITRRLTT